ncbi:hypothetical protein [Parapedobacter sp. SGR-10]|nr:hypothetical protein [Parapedobacter sp. SGR-10]
MEDLDKTDKQIKGLDKAYVVADDITHGFHHKIPLWLFGFLY